MMLNKKKGNRIHFFVISLSFSSVDDWLQLFTPMIPSALTEIFLFFIFFPPLWSKTWKTEIEKIKQVYQRTQRSMYLKYDVAGIRSLIEDSNAASTKSVVTANITLSLKFSNLIKRLKYAKSQSKIVGKRFQWFGRSKYDEIQS